MDDLSALVKSGLSKLVSNAMARHARGKIRTRPYCVNIVFEVRASKKVLRRMMKVAEEKASSLGRKLLMLLNSLGMTPGEIQLVDAKPEMKMLKPGQYRLVVKLDVKAENKTVLKDAIKQIESNVASMPGSLVLATFGARSSEVTVDSWKVEVV